MAKIPRSCLRYCGKCGGEKVRISGLGPARYVCHCVEWKETMAFLGRVRNRKH